MKGGSYVGMSLLLPQDWPEIGLFRKNRAVGDDWVGRARLWKALTVRERISERGCEKWRDASHSRSRSVRLSRGKLGWGVDGQVRERDAKRSWLCGLKRKANFL